MSQVGDGLTLLIREMDRIKNKIKCMSTLANLIEDRGVAINELAWAIDHG